MADLQTAIANQIRNIEAKIGKSFKVLCRMIAESGLTKIGEQRSMLIDRLGLGYGDANLVALKAKEAVTPAPAAADLSRRSMVVPRRLCAPCTSGCVRRSTS